MSAVWFNWKYRYTLSTSRVIVLSLVKWKYRHTLSHSSVVVLSFVKWTYKHTLLNNGMLILNETWDRGISTWLYHWGSNNLPVLEEFAALCVGNLKYRKIDILASHFTYINTYHTSHFRLCVGNISRIKTQEQFPTQKVGNFRCNSVSIYMLMYIYIRTGYHHTSWYYGKSWTWTHQ